MSILLFKNVSILSANIGYIVKALLSLKLDDVMTDDRNIIILFLIGEVDFLPC